MAGDATAGVHRRRGGAPRIVWGHAPVLLSESHALWEHRDVVGDLLVGAVWIAAGAALWPRRSGLLTALVGATWLLGTLVPELVLLHRGALAHVLLAYTSGRLGS